MNTGQACKDCMWGQSDGGDIECHAGPKVWCRGEYEGWWAFPVMDKDDWCRLFISQNEENQERFDFQKPMRGNFKW